MDNKSLTKILLFFFFYFRQLFAFVEFQTSESSLQSLHGYVPGANSNLFVDNEINLYKKIIEEMIRPYFYLILSYFKIENNFFILEDIVL